MAESYSRHRELDNYANQNNPNHIAFWKSRGFNSRPDRWEDFIIWVKIYEKPLNYETLELFEVCDGSYDEDIPTLSAMSKHDLDNRSNQLNPNNYAYMASRGLVTVRPSNWEVTADRNNRANQRNPNNLSFWSSRNFEVQPINWKDFIIWTQIEMRPINPCTWMEFSNIKKLDNGGDMSTVGTAGKIGMGIVGIAAALGTAFMLQRRSNGNQGN